MHSGISFRQVETFYWVNRLGSFSGAAAHLNTTQPAISNRIRELERFVGTQLFTRGRRSIGLTPEGRNFFGIAERFVEIGEEFLSRAAGGREISGILRIGAADTVALTWLPRLVTELARRYPRLDVELFVDLSVYIQAKLAEGDLDIGFLVGGAPGPDFVELPLGNVRNAWMCSPVLGLEGREVTAADLAAYPILTHTRGSHLYNSVREWFARAGVKRLRIHGFSSLATMIEMTAAGLGVSVLPPEMLKSYGRPDRLVEINAHPRLPSTSFSCIHANSPPAAMYAAAIEIARREMAAEPCFEVCASPASET
jgi:DNA-binding transcriptional LysR family regulator